MIKHLYLTEVACRSEKHFSATCVACSMEQALQEFRSKELSVHLIQRLHQVSKDTPIGIVSMNAGDFEPAIGVLLTKDDLDMVGLGIDVAMHECQLPDSLTDNGIEEVIGLIKKLGLESKFPWLFSEVKSKNNIHDKVFTCPKCHNKTLVPVEEPGVIGIGYHDLCICEECAAELLAEPQFDFTVKFVEPEEE